MNRNGPSWTALLAVLGAGAFTFFLGAISGGVLEPKIRIPLMAFGFLLIAAVVMWLARPSSPPPASPPVQPGPAVPPPVTDLFAGLNLTDEPVHDRVDTKDLLADRIARIEERTDNHDRQLGKLTEDLVDQEKLVTHALGTLRREVERISHTFGAADDDR